MDYYQQFGISPDASQEVIKAVYRKHARTYHPDLSQDPDAERKMKIINEIYEVLSDPVKRAAYDQKLKDGGSEQNSNSGSSNNNTGSAKQGTVPDPIIAVKPTRLDFGTLKVGDVATQKFVIVNTGGPTINDPVISVQQDFSWMKLSAQFSNGADPFPIWVIVDIDLTGSVPGSYHETVSFEVDGLEILVPVTVKIDPLPVPKAAPPAASGYPNQAPPSASKSANVSGAASPAPLPYVSPSRLRAGKVFLAFMILLILVAVAGRSYSAHLKTLPAPPPPAGSQTFRVGQVVSWNGAHALYKEPQLDTGLISNLLFGSRNYTITSGTNCDCRWLILGGPYHSQSPFDNLIWWKVTQANNPSDMFTGYVPQVYNGNQLRLSKLN